MPTSKKKAAKKTSSKKKTAAKKAVAVSRVNLQFPLDAAKVAAIKRCLAKGTLKVTVNKADLSRGRLRDPYIYD